MLALSPILFSILLRVLLPSPVSAQNAVCLPGWEWTYNINGSSPCDVAASLRATCQNTPNYTLAAIADGYHYEANGDCCCNLQVFNLESACGACQGRGWITWDRWTAACTGSPSTGAYPNTVPAGLVLQTWTGMRSDNLASGNWTPDAAGAVLVAAAGAASTASSSGSGVNVGVVLAAVLGTIGALVLVILAYIAWRKQRRQSDEDEPLSPSSAAFRATSRSPRPRSRGSPDVHRHASSATKLSDNTISSSTPLVAPGPRSEVYRQPSPYSTVSAATTYATSPVSPANRYSPPGSANGWQGSVANTSMATANMSPAPDMAQHRGQTMYGGNQYASLGYANAMNAATSGGGARPSVVRGPRAPGAPAPAPGRAGTPRGYSGLGEIM